MNFSVSLRLYLLSYERSSKCEFDEVGLPYKRQVLKRGSFGNQRFWRVFPVAHYQVICAAESIVMVQM